jgi:hypothetical protein
MKKGYKIGLFGELISESSINSILEQGFNAAKIKPIGSSGGGAPKATTPAAVNPKAPERAKEKTKVETKVENYKDVASQIDKYFTNIYSNITKLYDPKDPLYKLFYSHRGGWYVGGDDEASAMEELFGTNTISGNDIYTNYFMGAKNGSSKFWGVHVLPDLNKIFKFKNQIQKTAESNGWKWEIEEDEDFWKLLNSNIEQLWTVFKDIIFKSTSRYWEKTWYNVSYRPTLSAYSDNAPIQTYSFNLDF